MGDSPRTRRSRRVFGTWTVICAVFSAAALLLSSVPATATADRPPAPTPNPWQMRHWPQTQPWQRSQPAAGATRGPSPRPIDPQNYELPDTMTWDDYKPIPGTNWNDPAEKGSVRNFKGALVLVDYPNQPFVDHPAEELHASTATRPRVSDVPRAQVPQFYQDFLNTPERAQPRPHHPRVLDGGLRRPVRHRPGRVRRRTRCRPRATSTASSPDAARRRAAPPATPATATSARDARAAWIADVGEDVAAQYDFVFFLSAGQDESSTWQEFGEMKFNTKDDVTDAVRPARRRRCRTGTTTRYVDWTSWQASSNIWPNASQRQLDPGGELRHVARTRTSSATSWASATTTTTRTRCPPRRDYSGPWEMLEPRHVQRSRRPAQPLADPGHRRLVDGRRSTCCATS